MLPGGGKTEEADRSQHGQEEEKEGHRRRCGEEVLLQVHPGDFQPNFFFC
jgi:hypothetical protein